MAVSTQSITLMGNTPNTPHVNLAGKYPRTDDTGGVARYFASKGSIFFVIDSNSPTSSTSPLLYFKQYPDNNISQQESLTLNLQLSQYFCGIQGYQFHKHFNIFISGEPSQPNTQNTYLDLYETFNGNTQYSNPENINWANSVYYDPINDQFIVRIAGVFTKGIKSIFKGIYHIY